MTASWHVLVVDGNRERLTARGNQLLLDGYEVTSASTRRATELKLAEGPAAMILGELRTAPQTLGLLRELRRGDLAGADSRVAVLTVGADSDGQAISHYKAGADLALPSSASPSLVSAGLEALEARVGSRAAPRVARVGALTVDYDARTASVNGRPLSLTRLEFDLLRTLSHAPTRVHTRAELTESVWGYDPAVAGDSTTLRSHQSRLRKKLAQADAEGLVHNVRGVGLRLTTD